MVAYHGTKRIEQVLQEGLIAGKADGGCPHIWLARSCEDAARYGTVVEVDVAGLGSWPVDENGSDWQACYHGGDIEPSRLKEVPSD